MSKAGMVERLLEQFKAGYTLTWDGRDGEGKTVGSGVYLYRLVAEGFQSARRMALIQ